MKKLYLTLVLALAIPVLYGCVEDDPFAEAVEAIELDNTYVRLYLGETFQLNAAVSPEEAAEARIKWSTGDKKVVTVNNGLLTAVGKGDSYVIATAGACLDTCYVSVLDEGQFYEWTDNKQVYSMFKDSYKNPKEDFEEYGNTYVRDYFLMSEVSGDNVSMSGISTDLFYYWIRLEQDDAANAKFWKVANSIIRVANNAISKLSQGGDSHALGEDLFFRALVNFNLVTLYAKPYIMGRDNPGIPLILEAGKKDAQVATVGEVYDAILKDLEMAAQNLKPRSETGPSAGVVSREAALALKTRVLLYMERNDECVALCNELLSANNGYGKLDYDLENYFRNAPYRKETIWCVEHYPEDTKERGSLGSMYYSDPLNDSGWGEMYWTDELMDLFQRYPQDRRFLAYWYQPFVLNDGTKMIHWPIIEEKSGLGNRHSAVVGGEGKGVMADASGNYSFVYEGENYTAKKELINGYPAYFINYEGQKTKVHVSDNVDINRGVRYNGGGSYPKYFNTKFSFQDGDPNLSSPVVLRWAEVILNKAEAEAKLGMDAAALEDVNVIRSRAGLADALMLASNYQQRGYNSILDVVLDERRMELCFEGHRTMDLIRNRKSIDRRFPGLHVWEVVDYTDSRLQRQIPKNF